MKFTKFKKAMLVIAIALSAVPGMSGPTFADAENFNEGYSSDSEEVCYRELKSQDILAFGAVTIATATVVGGWCVVDGEVSSAEYLDSFAETQTPFHTVIDSANLKQGAEVVDGEARIFRQFHIEFLAETPWVLVRKPTYACARITGASDSTARVDGGCTAY